MPPSARGALWCMAIGNALGLTDEDFDEKVAAAGAYAAAAAAAGGGHAGAGDGAATTAPDDCSRSADEKRENESILRAQIEMDQQRTMPRYCYSR